jgi:PIN domain nuclease of toxin-antitoxin system
MTYLIDTQVLIWTLVSTEKIPSNIRFLLETNTVYVSAVSLLEITVKQQVGKLPTLSVTTDELLQRAVDDGFILLPLTTQHIANYRAIPLYADHRDPFDRLILATALAEEIPVISADEKFQRYQPVVAVIW